MGKDDGGGMVLQGEAGNFARLCGGFGKRAACDFFGGKQAVVGIEKQGEGDFNALVPDTQPQIVARCFRIGQHGLLPQLFAQYAPPDFQNGGKLCPSRQPHAFVPLQILCGCVHHAAQAAV